MNEDYFVIIPDEKYGIRIEKLSKEQLEDSLNIDNDGFCDYGKNIEFLNHIPNYFSYSEDENKIILIKGNIIVPKIVETVKKYEI